MSDFNLGNRNLFFHKNSLEEFDNNKIIQKHTFICKEIANASDCISLTKPRV